MLNRDEANAYYDDMVDLFRQRAVEQFKYFVMWMKSDYSMQWFHKYICEKLQQFEEGKIKKLMILAPPQHGKSELATRLFSAYLLGRNPDRRIALTNYSHSMSSGFNRDIQRYIDSEKYHELFPETLLPGSKLFPTNVSNYARTAIQFEIILKRGSLRSVGRGGSLTGATVDIGIIDDLFKDRDEARSMTISESAWQWYVDVFSTRLHNESQQLLMNTRWDEFDLAGRLLEKERDDWEVIKFPAIKTEDVVEFDPREPGEALWEKRHSKKKILALKGLSEESFNSLYQQDPKPNSVLLIYNNWVEIPEWPSHIEGNITYGLDFGKTTGTWALIKCMMVGESIYFQELMYKRNSGGEDVDKVLKHVGYQEGQLIYCDYEPIKINELILMGYNAVPAIKGAGSVSFGIGKLQKTNVYYTADSFNLKMEKNRYQFYAIGHIITNEPDPTCADHAMDACRYGTVSRFFNNE